MRSRAGRAAIGRGSGRSSPIVAAAADARRGASPSSFSACPTSARASASRSARSSALDIRGQADRRRLESGNELLAVHGEISNQTDEVQHVPQIRAELKDAQGRVVYTWSIAPPVRELQARGRVPFDSRRDGRAARRPDARASASGRSPDADRDIDRRRRRAGPQCLHPLGRALGRRSGLGGDRLPARLGRGDADRSRPIRPASPPIRSR